MPDVTRPYHLEKFRSDVERSDSQGEPVLHWIAGGRLRQRGAISGNRHANLYSGSVLQQRSNIAASLRDIPLGVSLSRRTDEYPYKEHSLVVARRRLARDLPIQPDDAPAVAPLFRPASQLAAPYIRLETGKLELSSGAIVHQKSAKHSFAVSAFLYRGGSWKLPYANPPGLSRKQLTSL